MGQHNQRKLRNLFTRNPFQTRIILTSLIFLMIILFLVFLVIFSPSIHRLATSTDSDIRYQEAQFFLQIFARLLPLLPFLVLTFVAYLVVITHRICGPLINFNHTFRKITEGDLRRKIFIRKNDYLREEAELINTMIDGLTLKIEGLRNDRREICRLLETVREETPEETVRQRIKETIALLQNTDSLTDENDGFFLNTTKKTP